ncbi:MAG: hypothetical protein WKF97_14735 [Chitinophagaceae bacterium]
MNNGEKNIAATKASGDIEPFLIQKLRNSLARAKATTDEINSIVETLLPKLYQGVSTQKIYSEAFRLLRPHSKDHAASYYLKRGTMELDPSGFRFERFIGELFKHRGYTVQVGKILQGKCVTREIDLIAEKENQLNLMECKYRKYSTRSLPPFHVIRYQAFHRIRATIPQDKSHRFEKAAFSFRGDDLFYSGGDVFHSFRRRNFLFFS